MRLSKKEIIEEAVSNKLHAVESHSGQSDEKLQINQLEILYVFIILIVSCTNVIVVLGNLSTMPSVSMKVYNIPLKFQGDCMCKS